VTHRTRDPPRQKPWQRPVPAGAARLSFCEVRSGSGAGGENGTAVPEGSHHPRGPRRHGSPGVFQAKGEKKNGGKWQYNIKPSRWTVSWSPPGFGFRLEDGAGRSPSSPGMPRGGKPSSRTSSTTEHQAICSEARPAEVLVRRPSECSTSEKKNPPTFRRRGSAARSPPAEPRITRRGARQRGGRTAHALDARPGTGSGSQRFLSAHGPGTGSRHGRRFAQPRRTAAARPSHDTPRLPPWPFP